MRCLASFLRDGLGMGFRGVRVDLFLRQQGKEASAGCFCVWLGRMPGVLGSKEWT